MNLVDDPRIAPVEDNLVEFFTAVQATVVDVRDEPEGLWWTSDIGFPVFNGAIATRCSADPAGSLRWARETLDRLSERGLPFMWWLTPRTRNAELDALLVDRGMVATPGTIGMHSPLAQLHYGERLPEGVTLEPVVEDDVDDALEVMVEGFAMPLEIGAPFADVTFCPTKPGATRLHVLARLDGQPAGVGSVLIAHGVAGVYNVATLEVARGRGIGRAVTLELMRLGREHGCSDTILHATPMGLPVYERLGYRRVCEVDRVMWLPPAD